MAAHPAIVITRTPQTIGLAGADLRHTGAVNGSCGAAVTAAIDQCLYVTVKRQSEVFQEQYRLNYSEAEHVDRLEDIRNAIVRECLKLTPVAPPLFVSTVADIPASAGLGSSSCFAVGLLLALHTLRGEKVSAGQIAEEAAEIEISRLDRAAGREHHFASAFGGLTFMEFSESDRVQVEPIQTPPGDLQRLFDNLRLFWLPPGETAVEDAPPPQERAPGGVARAAAEALRAELSRGFDGAALGRLLTAGRARASGRNDPAGTMLARAIGAGAWGGRAFGANGDSFLLVATPPDIGPAVGEALDGTQAVGLRPDVHGARVVLAAGEA